VVATLPRLRLPHGRGGVPRDGPFWMEWIVLVRPTDIGPPITDDSNDYRVTAPPPCVACGHVHGGVNVEIICLRIEVIRLRQELEPMRKLRAEVKEMGSSHVQDRGK
jgi:hypothetical protein